MSADTESTRGPVAPADGDATARPAPAPRLRPTPVVVALLLGLAVGRWVCAPGGAAAPPGGAVPTPAAGSAAEVTVWTCSMHPQVRLPEQGLCPICHMELIPLTGGADDGLHPRRLQVSENAAALAGLVVAPVERRSVSRQVRMVGEVDFDETRMAYVTAWVPYRIERLFVDFTGLNVRAGDHLAEVYSPELIATQQELIAAVRARSGLTGDVPAGVADRQDATVVSARERLRLWGLAPGQIASIEERGEPLERVTLNAPVGGVVVHLQAREGDYAQTGTRLFTIADLSHVWVQLAAYERDLTWLHYGQQVSFVTEAYPGETFTGRVSFIDPVLDGRTRTVKVRVNVDNTDGRLKPDMFVSATVQAPMTAGGRLVDPELAGRFMCPMHPEAVADEAGDCPLCGMPLVPTEELGFRVAESGELPLVIPDTAPLVTGERAVVYVRLAGDGPPVFEGREIVLGPRAEGAYVVREGLEEGELVVARGAFKLDSELQLRARPSMMTPAGDDSHGRLGGGDGSPRGAGAAPRVAAPAAFVEGLARLAPALLDAGDALAADDPEAARVAGARLGQALAEVPSGGLPAPVQERWMPLATRLSDAAGRLSSDADVEILRAALRDAHAAALDAYDGFGWQGTGEAPAVFHCPMAFGGGADWLGRGGQVANPYYGAAMLRCGDRVRSLSEER